MVSGSPDDRNDIVVSSLVEVREDVFYYCVLDDWLVAVSSGCFKDHVIHK